MTQKICTVCDANLAGRKRVKDEKGRYYCAPCWTLAVQQVRADAAAPAEHSEAGLPAPVQAEPELLSCETCGGMFAPERLRMIEDRVICEDCGRAGTTGAVGLASPPEGRLAELKRSWGYMWKPEMAAGGLALAGALGLLLPMLLFDESTGAARAVAIAWMCLGGLAGALCFLAVPYYLVRRTIAAARIADHFRLSSPAMWAVGTLVPGVGLLVVFLLDGKAHRELKDAGLIGRGK